MTRDRNGLDRAALDRHIAGGDFHRTTVDMRCANGHRWTASATVEYGSMTLDDEDGGWRCGACGLPDVEYESVTRKGKEESCCKDCNECYSDDPCCVHAGRTTHEEGERCEDCGVDRPVSEMVKLSDREGEGIVLCGDCAAKANVPLDEESASKIRAEQKRTCWMCGLYNGTPSLCKCKRYDLSVSFAGRHYSLERLIVRIVGWAEVRKQWNREDGTTVMYFEFTNKAVRDAARERIAARRDELKLGRIDRYDIG